MSGREATRWLRYFRREQEAAVSLVCLPHAGGSAAFFRPWARLLPPEVELVAVQYPGRLDRLSERCVDDMDRLADDVAAAVRDVARLPVALLGHSLGAVVAYEVTHRLERRGLRPVRLFVSGHPAPQRARPGVTHLSSDEELWAHVVALGGTHAALEADDEVRMLALPALRSDYRLAETYRPRGVPGLQCPVTAFAGDADTEVMLDDVRAWSEVSRGGFDLRVFPGGHFYLMPQAANVVDALLSRLSPDLSRY